MSKTIEVELDEARELMYDELAEQFGEEFIEPDLEAVAKQRLTELYDNQDSIKQQIRNRQE